MHLSVKSRKGKNEIYRPRTRERSSSIKLTNKLSSDSNRQINTVIKSTEVTYGASPKTLGFGLTKTSPQIEEFTDTRTKEKYQMQDLNSRLAHYIQISRYNEALNKKLKEAIEKLKDFPNKDVDDIKKMYEIEMGQLRDLLENAENEKNKEKYADDDRDTYNDLLERLKDCETTEEDNRERIKQQFENLADYEAKIARIQREIEMENDNRNRNKATIEKLRMALFDIKNAITNETLARIESQTQYQIIKDELDALKELNEKELEQIKFMPYEDKINQSKDWWSNEFSNSIKEIQDEYDNRLASIKNDLQSSYACKVHEIQTAVARTNTESATMRDKYTVLKDSSTKLRNDLNDTKQENLLLTSQNEHLQNELNDLQMQCDQLTIEKNSEMTDIKEQLEKTLSELQNIMDNNMTLKLEIDSYKTLLENEEIRMGINQDFERKNESFQQYSNLMYDETQNQIPKMIKGTVEKKTTYQKSNKGPISISEVADDGSFISLTNINHSKPEVLKGYRIMQNVDNINFSEYEIENTILNPEQTIRIWANGSGKPRENDQIWINKTVLGVGAKVITTLINSRGDEKATYTLKTNYAA